MASNLDDLESSFLQELVPKGEDLYSKVGEKYNLDPKLLKAWAQKESSLNPKAFVPSTKAAGLMQQRPLFQKEWGVKDPYDPEQALEGAAKYLKKKMDSGSDLETALKIYHGGPNEKNWGSINAQYPKDILDNYKGLGGTGFGVDPLSSLEEQAGKEISPLDKAPAPLPPENPTTWNSALNLGNANALGFGTNIMAGVQAAKESLGGGLPFGEAYKQSLAHYEGERKKYAEENPTSNLTTNIVGSTPSTLGAMALGQEYALAPAARLVGGPAAAEFLTGGSGVGSGIGNFAKRMVSLGASGAIQGGEAGALTSKLTGQTPLEGAEEGAKVGLVLNPALGAVGGRFGSAISPQIAKLVQKTQDLGVPIRTGQIPGISPLVEGMDKTLTSGARNAEQRGAFTKAVAKTFGEDTDSITHDTVLNARKRIGQDLNNIASRTTIPGDNTLLGDLSAVENKALQEPMLDTSFGQIKKARELVENDILSGGFKLTGDSYQKLTKTGGPIAKMIASPDPFVRDAGHDFREALDQALERHASPSDLEALKTARSQWKALRAVEPIVDDATGEISPNKLLGSVKRNYKTYASRGAGDLGTLGEAGKNLIPGAAGKENDPSFLGKVLAHGFAPVGMGIGAVEAAQPFLDNPLTAALGMAGAGIGYGVGKGANSLIQNSPLYQRMLLERALGQRLPYANALIPPATMLYNNKGQQ